MKKIYGLIGFGILAFVLFFSLVSASISVNASDKTLAQKDDSFTFVITNNNETVNATANVSIENLKQNTDYVTFSIDGSGNQKIITIPANDSITVNVTYDVQQYFDFEFGKIYSTILFVDGDDKATLTFEETSFCEEPMNSKIDLEIKDVKVEGFGDEDEWYLRDEIEVEVEIENKASDWDLDNIEIEWELYSDGESIEDGKATEIDLKDGDDETIYFTIKLDENIEDFGSDATLYVRATGEINSDDDYDEDLICDWNEWDADISKDDFVIVDNIKIDNVRAERNAYNQLSCEDDYTVSFEAWNIGDGDEDDVYVEVYSKELEIYEKFDIAEIEAFEASRIFEFNFVVPEDLEEGKYTLEFEVFDEDGDIYENGNDDESRVNIRFENAENCLVVQPTITASLETEAVEGNEMVVKINVRNDDVKTRTFMINPEGYQEWARLKSVSTEAFTLESGKVLEVSAVFDIKKDMEGEKTFKINVFSEGKLISAQPMAVNVEAKPGISDLFDGINWKLVGIVFINLVLVIAIVIVVRKILKKK